MSRQKLFTRELAHALLSVDWSIEAQKKQIETALGFLPQWAEPLLQAMHKQFADKYPRISAENLDRFIIAHPYFLQAWREHSRDLSIRRYTLSSGASTTPLIECDVPQLECMDDLAAWLGISKPRLEGFADNHGLEQKHSQSHQRHYHYIWKSKRLGADRLLEIPKSNLRAIQRKIHTEILQHVPLHPACHGFRKEHSCVTFAQAHCSERRVIRMDLQRFFTSIPLRRVHAIYAGIGYRTEVARLLSGLCSNQTPFDVLRAKHKSKWRQNQQFTAPHLPQGAPTSPTLSNLAAWKLDVRLSALMKHMDGNYTRYADDLALSGDYSKTEATHLVTLVRNIAEDEGFTVNHRKTRIMTQASRQRLTGLSINQHVNYPREKYDKLKAILYNCGRFGPVSQNREKHPAFKAHLQGRVAHVQSINPQRALRLQRLFDRIEWD